MMLPSRPWILTDLRRRGDASPACQEMLRRAAWDLEDPDWPIGDLVVWEWWVLALECYRRDPRAEVAWGIMEGEVDPTMGET